MKKLKSTLFLLLGIALGVPLALAVPVVVGALIGFFGWQVGLFISGDFTGWQWHFDSIAPTPLPYLFLVACTLVGGYGGTLLSFGILNRLLD